MNSLDKLDFTEPFNFAIVRLATYLESSSSQSRLLFGSVSLVVNDRPRPKSTPTAESFKIANGKHGRIFFRRIVLTVPQAIEWYRAGALNRMTVPTPADDQEIVATDEQEEFTVSNFFDDPAWPTLGIPCGIDFLFNSGGPGDPAPFVGSGSAPSRIHRRFGNIEGFVAITSDPGAVDFLKRRIHVDLSDYTEYRGSLVLVVPNPIVRRVRFHVVPNTGKESENIVFRLIPRSGQTLEGLSLTVFELSANLMSRFETVSVPKDGLIVLPRKSPVHKIGYVLTHLEGEILAYQPPLSFIRAINASIGVVRPVRIESPKTESLTSEISYYDVSEISHEDKMSIGPFSPAPDLSRVFEAEERRQRRAQARRYDQTWIEGQRDDALQFIRERIQRARFYVLVADPYFGALQISQFLQAVSEIHVKLTILTSRLAFGGSNCFKEGDRKRADLRHPPDSFEKHNVEQDRLSKFSGHISRLKKRGIENVSALVLKGKKLPLHDRFLVIDDTVWLLGNSLNALGLRASLILQVPDGEPIIKSLNEMQKNAIAFDRYFEKRRRDSLPQSPRG